MPVLGGLYVIASHGAMRQRRQVGSAASHQAEFAQFPPQRFRHGGYALRYFIEVARRFFRGEIAPPLERAKRPWRNQNHFAVEHEPAAPDAVLVDERANVTDDLAA